MSVSGLLPALINSRECRQVATFALQISKSGTWHVYKNFSFGFVHIIKHKGIGRSRSIAPILIYEESPFWASDPDAAENEVNVCNFCSIGSSRIHHRLGVSSLREISYTCGLRVVFVPSISPIPRTLSRQEFPASDFSSKWKISQPVGY